VDYLPLFADLKARPVLVVGGGDIAVRKISLLRRAGAVVRIVAKKLAAELQRDVDAGHVEWLAQEFDEQQLDQVFLVIAATNNRELNRRVFDAANARHRLVNVVDDQPLCSFIFPSIVDRSPLVVAVSSGGNAPVLARLLREKIEALLPQSLGRMAAVAGSFRERIKTVLSTTDARRRFWEQAFRGRFASLMAAGNETAARENLEATLANPQQQTGEIILVGAGPGDAGLLTLRGLQVLQQADVVLYDHLVSDGVLELIRRDADRICVGKRAGEHAVAQHQTNQMLVDLAREGKTVVRLKGGDPFIFGRGGEELQAAQQAGIAFQVVPGITAAAGATAYAGIPLTHREHAQSVTFVTGHYKPDSQPFDWAHLAQGRQTLAIYMGTMKAAHISEQLIQHGRSADTPVAVISRGTRSDQQVLTGTLQQLDDLAKRSPMPALLVIGEVVALNTQLVWFQPTTQAEDDSSAVVTLA